MIYEQFLDQFGLCLSFPLESKFLNNKNYIWTVEFCLQHSRHSGNTPANVEEYKDIGILLEPPYKWEVMCF